MGVTLDEARRVLKAFGFHDIPTPWTIAAANSLEEYDWYADYAGWESWVQCGPVDLADAIDEMEGIACSLLYGAFVEATRFAYEAGKKDAKAGGE